MIRSRTSGGRQRKVTRAFKIEESLDDSIVNYAEKAGITPSSYVSQILRKHIEWGQFVGPGTTFLTIDKVVLESFLEEVDEERLVEIARSLTLVSTHDYLKFRYQKINFESVMDFLRLMSSYANIGEMNVVSDGERPGLYEINVRHSLGMKWSIFLSEYISGMLSSFLEMRTTAEISPLGCSIVATKP